MAVDHSISSSDPDVLVRVSGVSKKFCLSLKKSLWYGLCDMGRELTGRRHGEAHARGQETGDRGQEDRGPRSEASGQRSEASEPSTFTLQPATDTGLRPKEFWAVHDVSFELKRGECLGLIGRNGAGKTTLLKMLNGLIKPDSGRIEMRGRVGALISLGAGFNGILTGRENIYTNASVLGLSKKETDAKLDEIIDFAEIGDFIDTPVQNYSSGMVVRLGFAVASSLDPDILLLDEVLAVGDAAFRNKCYNRIGKLKNKAGVIFVSHAMDQVSQFCDSSLVLSAGRQMYYGNVKAAIDTYENLLGGRLAADNMAFENIAEPVTEAQTTIGPSQIPYGGELCVTVRVVMTRPIANAWLKIVLYDELYRPFAQWSNEHIGATIKLRPGNNVLQVRLGPLHLRTGKYCLGVVLNNEDRIAMLFWSYKKLAFTVEGAVSAGPAIALQAKLIQCEGQDQGDRHE